MKKDYSYIPVLEDVRSTYKKIAPYIRKTPIWLWESPLINANFTDATSIYLKLEHWQNTGTFKPRGALSVMLNLDDKDRKRGVVAASGGNHAVAVSYAAAVLGISAKVVVPKTSSPTRISMCKQYGAEVVHTESMREVFEKAGQIEKDEGRINVHPFEGPYTALGTATLGLELLEQIPSVQVVIVAVGGGGLIAGLSAAVKQISPQCEVIGVEPEGADAIYRSMHSGKPEKILKANTIADSLSAPYALPYSFGLIKKFVDRVVLVNDNELRRAMLLIFNELKLALEPAGAAATAALLGPLKEHVKGKRTAVIVCGSNIGLSEFYSECEKCVV